MYQFIYPPTVNYNWLYQRPQQLTAAFAKIGYTSIFYSKQRKQELYHPIPGCTIAPDNWQASPHAPDTKVVLWVSHPRTHITQIKRYRHHILVFDAIDMPVGEFSGWQEGYNELAGLADVVFTTAQALYDLNRSLNSQVYMLPNAADFLHFNTPVDIHPTLNPFKSDNKPIIMYIGAVASWLDWDLLDQVISACPHYNFIMIGPLYNIKPTKQLLKPNLYYLGNQDYKDLPGFSQYADVCINPFLINEMTVGVDPIKVYEYMATGKPIVSTPLPELIKYNEIMHIADTSDAFINAINQSIASPTWQRSQRIEIAQEHSWVARALTAASVLDTIHTGDDYKEYPEPEPEPEPKPKIPKPRMQQNWRRI